MLFCLQALFFSYSHAASAVSKKNAGYSPAFLSEILMLIFHNQSKQRGSGRGNLKRGNEIEELMKRYEEHSHSRWYQAAMDLIIRANWENVKEEKNMCEALRELFADELRESEEKGLAAGAEKQIISVVCKKLGKNKGVSEISEALEEPEEKIRLICEAAADYAPDYDVDKIYDKLKEGENRK